MTGESPSVGGRRWMPSLAAALLLCAGAASSGALVEVEPPAGMQFFQDVAWSPDGERLAFSRIDTAEGQQTGWELVVSRVDGTDQRVVARNARWATWSPDGKRLAYTSNREGSWDLYQVDLDSGEAERLIWDDADERAPSWSPDGSEIAFTSNRDGNSEIYVLDLPTRQGRRLTSNPADDHNPVWSDDGSELVFYRASDPAGADQIYRISAEGAGERRLTDDRHLDIYPSPLPDGRVAFSQKDRDTGVKRIVVLNRDGSTTAVGPEGAFFARWSADGGRVAVIAGGWPRAAVYVMAADGSRLHKILN